MWLPWKRRTARVFVHTKENGPSFEGVLVGERAGHYVVAACKLLASAEEQHALDGDVWIPRENVLHVQVIR